MNSHAPLGSFEEQVLLAVIRTRAEAYGMAVRREIERATGRDVAVGAVYATLDRLEAKGMLESSRALATGSRRVFVATRLGLAVLAESRAIRDRLWAGVDLAGLGEGAG
jgi:PadR family transcriptional regulator, regulatory protein PadR